MLPLVSLYLESVSAWARWVEVLAATPFGGISADGAEYAPITTWFSPTFNFGAGAGDVVVERGVYREVASVGKQLGILTEAVLEGHEPATDGPAMARLRGVARDVESVKRRRRAAPAAVSPPT